MTATPMERMQHANSLDQRIAVAKLVGYCESIVRCGRLNEAQESSLRKYLAETRTVFDMASREECQATLAKLVKGVGDHADERVSA